MAGLFDLMKTRLAQGPFVTISRTHVKPPALEPEMQPGLFLVQQREERDPRPAGFGSKMTKTAFLILYFQAPDPADGPIGQETVCGDTTLNVLLDAIDDALKPDNVSTGKLTVGGLAQHVWIEGASDLDPGVFTSQGGAIIPLKILFVL